jgi:hypothetical protein
MSSSQEVNCAFLSCFFDADSSMLTFDNAMVCRPAIGSLGV